jgi:hypothetical protein
MQLSDYVYINTVYKEPPSVVKQTLDLANSMRKEIKTKDRTIFLKTYTNCFVARDAVTWISEYMNVDRDTAIRIGIYLQSKEYIAHIGPIDHVFKDNFLIFMFLEKRDELKSPGAAIPKTNTTLSGPTSNVQFLAIKVSLPRCHARTRTLTASSQISIENRYYCKIVVDDQVYTTPCTSKPYNFMTPFTMQVSNLPTVGYLFVLDKEKATTQGHDMIGYSCFLIEASERNYDAPIIDLISNKKLQVTGIAKLLFTIES